MGGGFNPMRLAVINEIYRDLIFTRGRVQEIYMRWVRSRRHSADYQLDMDELTNMPRTLYFIGWEISPPRVIFKPWGVLEVKFVSHVFQLTPSMRKIHMWAAPIPSVKGLKIYYLTKGGEFTWGSSKNT